VTQARPWAPKRRLTGARLLQMLKARAAVWQQYRHLAVDQRIAHAEPGGGVGDVGEPARPVLAAAANERRAAVQDAAADPVPIELDLMEPRVAAGRLGDQRGELRAVFTIHNRHTSHQLTPTRA